MTGSDKLRCCNGFCEWWPESRYCFGSTRSQVRILSPRSVTPRVLGEAGNPFFLPARESAREQGLSGLAFSPVGHGSVVAGVRAIRFDQGARSEFLLHLLQPFVCAERLRACRHRRASVGDGRPPLRGRRGCGGQGSSPAAAVAGHSSASMRAEVSPMPPRAAARPARHSGELVFGGCRSNFKSARPCGRSSAGVAGARHGARPAPGLLRVGPIWVSAMLAADGLILTTFHKPYRRNVSHSCRLPLPCVPPCAASCCTSPPISQP